MMEMELELDDMAEEEEIRDIPQETELEEVQDLEEQESELSEELRTALLKSPLDRTWREAEMVDIYRHPKYEAQAAFATDPDTGEALRDENGDLVRCSRRTPGAQVPDGFYEDEEGIHIREAKDGENLEELKADITKQAIDRWQAFGDDIDLVFAVSPHFTVAEAENLQRYCSDYLSKIGKVEVEYQLK